MLRCGMSFPKCGHKCTLLCHPMAHDVIICNAVCEKPREPGCTHPCALVCGRDCEPCRVKVSKARPSCGHTLSVKCSEEVEDARCTFPCPRSMVCGHACSAECSHNHPLSYKCPQPCLRSRLTCSHSCPKECFKDCGLCETIVSKQLLCGHSVEVPCHQDVTSYQCKQPCGKKLPNCDHKCPNKCHESCASVCLVVVKKKQPCCQQLIPHELKTKCGVALSSKPCIDLCKATLPGCPHLCQVFITLTTLLTPNNFNNPNNPNSPNTYVALQTLMTQAKCGDCKRTAITAASHPPCTRSCDKMLPCNHKCPGKHLCGTVCPPCTRPCATLCKHGACKQPCGVPCEPCVALCPDVCPHFRSNTSLLCGEVGLSFGNTYALVVPACVYCNQPCGKMLKCKHACLGLCGEVCPPLCVKCMAEKCKLAFKKLPVASSNAVVTKEQVSAARFIILNCTHAFEVRALDEHMRQQAQAQHYPQCPDCKATVQGVQRYKKLVRERMEHLRPPYFELHDEQLRADFEKDMRLKNYSAILDNGKLALESSSRTAGVVQRENPLQEYFIGRALERMGQYKEAVARLASSLQTATEKRLKAESANALGLLYRHNSQNIGKAVDYFEQALELEGSNAQVNLDEARAHYDQERQRQEQLARDRSAKQRLAEQAAKHAVAAHPPIPSAEGEFSDPQQLRNQLDQQQSEQDVENAQELQRSGGNNLHLAVLRERELDVASWLQHDKTSAWMQDYQKKTRKCSVVVVIDTMHLSDAHTALQPSVLLVCFYYTRPTCYDYTRQLCIGLQSSGTQQSSSCWFV
jgi:tetratricopeptide (TPR) repeat protein